MRLQLDGGAGDAGALFVCVWVSGLRELVLRAICDAAVVEVARLCVAGSRDSRLCE